LPSGPELRFNKISRACLRCADFLAIRRPWGWQSFDWDALRASHQLHRYDLLIFHPEWNDANFVNEDRRRDGDRGGGSMGGPRGGPVPPVFDGTRFNAFPLFANASRPPDYMLRLRRYRLKQLDFREYDVIYCLFLDRAFKFATLMRALPPRMRPPAERIVVKAYPGGGVERERWCCTAEGTPFAAFVRSLEAALGPASLRMHVIATNAPTLAHLSALLPRNPIVTVPGLASAFMSAARPTRRQPALRASGPLHACFTSIGQGRDKGVPEFLQLADAFERTSQPPAPRSAPRGGPMDPPWTPPHAPRGGSGRGGGVSSASGGDDGIIFHGVGHVPLHARVVHHESMPQVWGRGLLDTLRDPLRPTDRHTET